MDLIQYIKKYGNCSYEEKKVNEIDVLIMSMITYIDFGDVDNFYVKEEAINVLNRITKKEIRKKLHGIKSAYKILPYLIEAKRYGNLYVHDYIYEYDDYTQFGAMIFDIDKNISVIAFEGTDELISGWCEDLRMAYEFPVPAQKKALRYLKHHIKYFSKRKYILCGHSKGGHLALISSMYTKKYIKQKIKKIFSFDGLGLKSDEYNSEKFLSIKNKFDLVVPDFSIIGMLLYHPKKYRVVNSIKKNPYAHDPIYWSVDDKYFIPSKINDFCLRVDKNFKQALMEYNDDEKKDMIDDIFNIFKKADIKTLDELRDFNLRKLYLLINESRSTDIRIKNLIKDFIRFSIENVKENT